MELTQSAVEFPVRVVQDWYTLTDVIFGSGAFASVREAVDDREALLRLKYNVPPEEKMDGYLTEDLYVLRSDPSLMVVDRYVKSWQDLATYLANFDTKSLVLFFDQLFPDDKDAVLPNTRFELIMDMVENWERVYNETLLSDDEFLTTLYGSDADLRPTVAIKMMAKGLVSDKEEQKLINSAKTEVFGLGRVASKTPILLRLQFGAPQSTGEGGTTIATDPVGCVSMFGAPVIGCLLDYFYTPSRMHVNGLKPDTYYLVLSNNEGPTLLDLLKQLATPTRSQFGLSTGAPGMFVWYVAWVLAHALARSHEGKIIHNDVKLENVMFHEPTGGITLIDYGLSCHVHLGERRVGKLDGCDAFGGTPYYGAVEQMAAGKRFPVSDIWALGVMLWELATGQAYEVPGKDINEVSRAIIKGARPDLRDIPVSMPNYREFRIFLEHMFKAAPFDRPTAQQLIDWIATIFSPYGPIRPDPKVGMPEEIKRQVGDYLHEKGNEALQAALALPVVGLVEDLFADLAGPGLRRSRSSITPSRDAKRVKQDE